MAAPAVSPAEKQWLQGVSQQTGVSVGVLQAWQQAEGNPGAYQNNWLNILNTTAPSLGVPFQQGAYGVASYPNVQDAISATVKEMQNLGLGSLGGSTAGTQIAKIQESGWAGSNPPSGYVESEFVNDFGTQAMFTNPVNPTIQVAQNVANATGNAALSGVKDVANATGVGSVFSFLTSWRFAEVVGGVLLLLLGLLLLGKQFGLGATPPAAVARVVPGL